ncbi:unnamed protein product, partial [Caretta caretta]
MQMRSAPEVLFHNPPQLTTRCQVTFKMSIDLRRYIPAILVALAVSSSIVFILSLVRIQNVSLPPNNKYGMVFDAGSSHTSLFVYQWTSDKTNDTGVVSQMLSCNVQ